jgi:hypothetical protein
MQGRTQKLLYEPMIMEPTILDDIIGSSMAFILSHFIISRIRHSVYEIFSIDRLEHFLYSNFFFHFPGNSRVEKAMWATYKIFVSLYMQSVLKNQWPAEVYRYMTNIFIFYGAIIHNLNMYTLVAVAPLLSSWWRGREFECHSCQSNLRRFLKKK